MVALGGGKGGVGKSTVAVNLALSASADGLRTLLLDFDLGLGDVPLILGVDARSDLSAFLEKGRPITDCVIEGPSGLDYLALEQGDGTSVRDAGPITRRILTALAQLADPYDLVVVDCPSGIDAMTLELGMRARRMLVVTNPEPVAMTDAYGFVKALDAEAAERGVDLPTPELFINSCADRGEALRTAEHLSRVAQRFLSRGPRLAGWLPRSRAVARAVARQEPFVSSEPDCLPARLVSKLRKRLVDALVPSPRAA